MQCNGQSLLAPPEQIQTLKTIALACPSFSLSPLQLGDLELLLSRTFSPLVGYLNRADFESTLNTWRLVDGTLWPMHATPEGGAITLGTRRDNDKLLIEVRDTGCGITPANMPKIFDPFFTTKEPGKGTGLGLSLSHGIVARLGGTLTATSTPGKGATFTVSLPL